MSAPELKIGERLIALSINVEVPAQTRERLQDRNINVEKIDAEKYLADNVRPNPHAAVFTFREREFAPDMQVLLRLVPELLARGVLIFIRIQHRPVKADDEKTREIYRRIREGIVSLIEGQLRRAHIPHVRLSRRLTSHGSTKGTLYLPCVVISEALGSWSQLADLLERNVFRESPSQSLEVSVLSNGREERLDAPEDGLLIRRAFADCSNVTLEKMQDGLSGQAVYRCHAELQQGGLGAWPFTTLVKIGPRAKVIDEIEHYRSYVMTYIPYHLSPRLIEARCALGHQRGILVADFVSPSEPIRSIAPVGRADLAIMSLFTKTLSAWRYVAHRAERKNEAINTLLLKWPKFREAQHPSAWPCEKLAKALGGGRRSLADLHGVFAKLNGGKKTLVGPVHGDLHASNVLVRGGDAIVIDLGNIQQEGPMLFDVASLEAGLLIEGFARDTRVQTLKGCREWLASIMPLYRCDVIENWTEPCAPHDGSSWFFDCVRQLRTYALDLQHERHQYAIALAFCLLRKGCNPHPFKKPDSHLRAAALVLGERLLVDLESVVTENGESNVA